MIMSSVYVYANTTRENKPHALPRYNAPDPVTLQFTNENPVSSSMLILFCAVRAPTFNAIACTWQPYTEQKDYNKNQQTFSRAIIALL